MVYEIDYGYVKNTKSMDNSGIDVFVGSESRKRIDAIVCIIDLLKKESEIKILIGCTEEEKDRIYIFLNSSKFMKAIMVEK